MITKEKAMLRNEKVKNLALCAMFASLIAVCAWISIPMTVPFTLQTFAVFVAASVLGGKLGTISALVYIAMGAVGVPVFAGFTGGYGVLIGPTGGYIVGFLGITAMVWLTTGVFGDRLWTRAVGMAAGLLVCYAFGTGWFMVAYGVKSGAIGFTAVLLKCVIPFIIPDIAKLTLALAVAGRLKPTSSGKK